MEYHKIFSAIMHIWRNHLTIMVLMGISMLITTACTEDSLLSDDPDDPIAPKDSVNQIDPDFAGEHLVLTNATRIAGVLPTASGGQLKIDVKDSIYLIKGHPYGDRIHILHDEFQQVSGFYVAIKNSTFYFDVEETLIEGEAESDTVSTLLLDLDLPEDTQQSYPISIEVIIQPHNDTGLPLDEFERTLVIEDPENSSGKACNSIINESIPINNGAALQSIWVWEFTIRENSSGINLLSAPGLIFDLDNNGKVGGCCLFNATQFPPYFGCDSTATEWVEMEVDEYYVPLYDVLILEQNKSAYVWSAEAKQFLDRPNTDLCANTPVPAYISSISGPQGSGTHDFSPGATSLRLTFPNFSGFSKPPVNSQIEYTCHSLILSFGSEGDQFHKVYKLNRGEHDIFEFRQVWFD